MQLLRAVDELDELRKLDSFFLDEKIGCWYQVIQNFRAFVFTVTCTTEKELSEKYVEVRDHIAVSFQSQTLTRDSERWNLYLFFFVNSSVSEVVRQKIEQDKFSSRKVVCDQVTDVDDELIRSIVDQKIFGLEIGSSNHRVAFPLSELRSKYHRVFSVIDLVPHRPTSSDIHSILKPFVQ